MRADAGGRGSAPCGDRRDIDDHPATYRQMRPCELGGEEHQVQFVAHSEAPVVHGHVRDRSEARRRGIVIDDVDPAVLADGGFHPALRLLRVAEIDVAGARHPVALRAHELERFMLRLRVDIAAEHACAFAREAQRGRPALAASGTGDQRDLAIKTSHANCLPLACALCALIASGGNRLDHQRLGRARGRAFARLLLQLRRHRVHL